MSSGGIIDKMLDRIPGYGGYRDKERRRDSDRLIRESLVLEYGQQADRLGTFARALADERQILAVGVVDKPHRRLRSFIDRVRTASYGYAPLFSDTPIDARALDQLAAFDRSLSDQQEVLASQIGALTSTDPRAAEFKQRASEIETTIQGLDDRFSKRSEVLTSGQPSTDAKILDLLKTPAPSSAPVAYRLHEGEAVAYRDVNYTIVGRISAETESLSWRGFQLRGGADETWLLVSNDYATRPHLLTRSTDPVGELGDNVEVNGQTYNLQQTLNGIGEIIGPSGTAPDQPVRLLQYQPASGDIVLDVFDWGTSRLSLTGTAVDIADIDLFTREK